MYSRPICRLLIGLCLISTNVNSQHLFGNPNCAEWPQLNNSEKLNWLNAFLVPLNLTNVSRKKPAIDKFTQMPSLDPALKYVDLFCNNNPAAQSATGAIKFLDELTQ